MPPDVVEELAMGPFELKRESNVDEWAGLGVEVDPEVPVDDPADVAEVWTELELALGAELTADGAAELELAADVPAIVAVVALETEDVC